MGHKAGRSSNGVERRRKMRPATPAAMDGGPGNSTMRRSDQEHGEGVISAAIAVLIMAFLGAAMWVGFNAIWSDAESDISDQVERIGAESPGG